MYVFDTEVEGRWGKVREMEGGGGGGGKWGWKEVVKVEEVLGEVRDESGDESGGDESEP